MAHLLYFPRLNKNKNIMPHLHLQKFLMKNWIFLNRKIEVTRLEHVTLWNSKLQLKWGLQNYGSVLGVVDIPWSCDDLGVKARFWT